MSAKTRIPRLFQKLDFHFVPVELAKDPDAARRAKITVVVALVLTAACPLFAAVALFVYGQPAIAMVDIVAAGIALSVPFVLRSTRSLTLASSLALGVTVGAISLAAASVEGLTSPALTWLAAVPILASLIGGRRNAVRWALVCGAAVAAMVLLERWLPNREMPVEARRGSAAWNYLLMFAAVSTFAVLYERLNERTALVLAAAREALEKAREQAALSDRLHALGRLAAGVAHQINNPSAFVAGNVRLARDTVAQVRAGVTPSSELREVEAALSDALTGAVRITETVRDLKSLGRAGDERASPIDPAEVMEVSLRIASPQLKSRCSVEKNLQAVRPVWVNESRLGQVFVSLLMNAVDAMPQGRSARENLVRVTLRMHEGRVRAEVADNGVGIAPDALGRIFDPFFTTKPVGKGMGLGLSISRMLVEQLGGSLSVESVLGEGSVFRVELPVTPAVEPVVPAAERDDAPSRRLRILVIDDEPLVGRSLARLLGRRHDVELCTSAVEALARGDLPRFDVVLCDLMMPGMSGVDFYERVVKEWPQLEGRIGFLSGGTFTERVRQHADLFSARLVDKPFEPEKLNALLAALSGSGRDTPQA
ncbi:MAG: response regulator [Myxococcaceae bacterium]|nr:response regulator [Myxococcaceae bacterium]